MNHHRLTRSAALGLALAALAAPTAAAQQALRSPDTRDEWGDAGIGASAMLSLIPLALGSTSAITHRRQSVAGPRTATTADTSSAVSGPSPKGETRLQRGAT